MTPEQFWYDEPRLLEVYIRKHELELDDMNYNAWLFGLYTAKAVSSSLASAFSKEDKKENHYFEKPLKELTSEYIRKMKDKKETKETDYKNQYNYWAKLGRKEKGGNIKNGQ